MSGIDQLTSKMKKKMTLEDLPTPVNSMLLNERAVHKDVQSEVSTAAHPEVQLYAQPAVQAEVRASVQPATQIAVFTDSRTFTEDNEKRGEALLAVSTAKQQNSKTVATESLIHSQETYHSDRQLQGEVLDNNLPTTNAAFLETREAKQGIEKNTEKTEEKQSNKTETQQNRNPYKKQSQPAYPRKMTLYLTEELYKTFNDIYANRMLEGRKTEKGELMCEAVRLLAEHEAKNKLLNS